MTVRLFLSLLIIRTLSAGESAFASPESAAREYLSSLKNSNFEQCAALTSTAEISEFGRLMNVALNPKVKTPEWQAWTEANIPSNASKLSDAEIFKFFLTRSYPMYSAIKRSERMIGFVSESSTLGYVVYEQTINHPPMDLSKIRVMPVIKEKDRWFVRIPDFLWQIAERGKSIVESEGVR